MSNESSEVAPSQRGEPWQLVRIAEQAGDRYEMQTGAGQNVATSKQLMQHAVLAVNALQTLDPAVLGMGFTIDAMREHVMALIKQVSALQNELNEIRKCAADYFEPSADANAHVRLETSRYLREQGQRKNTCDNGVRG